MVNQQYHIHIIHSWTPSTVSQQKEHDVLSTYTRWGLCMTPCTVSAYTFEHRLPCCAWHMYIPMLEHTRVGDQEGIPENATQAQDIQAPPLNPFNPYPCMD